MTNERKREDDQENRSSTENQQNREQRQWKPIRGFRPRRRRLLKGIVGAGVLGTGGLSLGPTLVAAAQHEHSVPLGDSVEVDLIAGQEITAGTVEVDPDWLNEEVTVIYDTSGTNWKIRDTHLHVAQDFEDIPTNPAGNPRVGHFDHSGKPDPAPADTATYSIDIGDAQRLYIAAHAVVHAQGEGRETAWGAGERINDRGNWATYFVVEEAEDEECIGPDVTTWDEVGDIEEVGGPVILMGLDSEFGSGVDFHGPPEEHAAMVAAMLEDVTNDGEGILVLGGDPVANERIVEYWEDDVGNDPQVDEDVDFVHDISAMETVDFEGYALIGIVSGVGQILFGLTNDQNDVLIDRAADIAAFVNDGGGLLGKTQDGLDEPYGYVDPFGELEVVTGVKGQGAGGYEGIDLTEEGEALGLVEENWDDWCCWHDVYLEFPDFFDVLAYNDDDASDQQGEAAAIGGEQVVIDRQIALEITGPSNVSIGGEQCYKLELENEGEDEVTGTLEYELLSGQGSVTDIHDDPVTLAGGESVTLEDGLCVECDNEGTIEIDVCFVEDERILVEVRVEIECVADCVDPA